VIVGPVLIAFAVGYLAHALVRRLDRLDTRDAGPAWDGTTDPRTFTARQEGLR